MAPLQAEIEILRKQFHPSFTQHCNSPYCSVKLDCVIWATRTWTANTTAEIAPLVESCVFDSVLQYLNAPVTQAYHTVFDVVTYITCRVVHMLHMYLPND